MRVPTGVERALIFYLWIEHEAMREERGQIAGDVLVFEPYTLWGSIGGNVRVIERGKFYVRGTIYGNLTVEYGGRCHIFGRITGTLLVHHGAKVIHSGVVAGDCVNEGGRLYIDRNAQIIGKIKTKRGETKVESTPKADEAREVPDTSEGRRRYEL